MCLHPKQIANPNISRQQIALVGESARFLDSSLTSCKAQISVPCGTCVECRNTYYNSILQRAIVESLTSYVYFVTLTYDDNHIPSIELPNGKTIYYSDYSHIQNLFKRLRKHEIIDRDFRYLVALEYGDKRHRPHFHLLLFVARKNDDDKQYPYILERTLFDNIKRFYALNVGTRKQPNYEQLFTYRIKRVHGQVKTNYFVKYVDHDVSDYATMTTDTATNVKTIRYLISYVNKGSTFDVTIRHYLDEVKDPYLRKKLELLLNSKIRYSKGFGLGFYNGIKVEQSRTFVKTSYLSYLLHRAELPATYAEFMQHFPDMATHLSNFVCNLDLYFAKHSSLRFAVQHLEDKDFDIYFILLHYFPAFVTYITKRYYRTFDNDNISYFFKFLEPYNYQFQRIKTEYVNPDTFVANYINKGIESGYNARLPFLAFPLYSSNTFLPLCKFYKERFTTDEHLLYLYQLIGVENFDQWQEQFVEYCRSSKSNHPQGNQVLRESEILPQFVKNSTKTEKNLYNLLFTQKK